jgi:hypothetical protein
MPQTNQPQIPTDERRLKPAFGREVNAKGREIHKLVAAETR